MFVAQKRCQLIFFIWIAIKTVWNCFYLLCKHFYMKCFSKDKNRCLVYPQKPQIDFFHTSWGIFLKPFINLLLYLTLFWEHAKVQMRCHAVWSCLPKFHMLKALELLLLARAMLTLLSLRCKIFLSEWNKSSCCKNSW